MADRTSIGRLVLCWTLAGLMSAGVLTGCGGVNAGSGSATADLSGRVVAGPTCPVEVEGSPCPPAPVSSAIVELVNGSDVVARARTGSDGTFRLSAAPGSYTVRAALTGGYQSETSAPVTLRAGDEASVTLLLDTGIR